MRIAVVDDFQKDRDNLALQLEAYIRDNGLEGEIYGYPGGEETAWVFEGAGGLSDRHDPYADPGVKGRDE